MQTHLFTTEACENDDHVSCAGRYEGLGIIANCVCNCHEGKASHPEELPGETAFEDVVSHQSTLEEIEADSNNKQSRK